MPSGKLIRILVLASFGAYATGALLVSGVAVNVLLTTEPSPAGTGIDRQQLVSIQTLTLTAGSALIGYASIKGLRLGRRARRSGLARHDPEVRWLGWLLTASGLFSIPLLPSLWTLYFRFAPVASP